MSLHDWDWLRLVNLPLLLVAFGYTIRLYVRRTNLAPLPGPVRVQIQLTQLGMAATLFSAIYGTAEALIIGTPGSPRVLILFAAGLILNIAVFWPQIARRATAIRHHR